jgi:hypothetical protein
VNLPLALLFNFVPVLPPRPLSDYIVRGHKPL